MCDVISPIVLVFDANAKMPSGLLNGHLNQYGDFDLCLNALSPPEMDHLDFNSQYCLAGIQISVDPEQKFLEYLRTLFLSFELYKSKLDDVCIAEVAENLVLIQTSSISLSLYSLAM